MHWPTVQEINDMGARGLVAMWRSLPRATTEDQERVIERLSVRCEALGLVDAEGKVI